jgi:DNA-binding sugar fermentation-stimulating protein
MKREEMKEGIVVADGNNATKITKEEMMGTGKTELEAPEKGLRNKNYKEDEKWIRCDILVTSEDDHHIFMELKSAAMAASGKKIFLRTITTTR